MDVREKGRKTAGAPEAPAPSGWFDRLNELGERHARTIVIASTLLVIVTVLVVADAYYKRTIGPKAERERAAAATSKELQELKQKYRSVPSVAPLIVLDLGHKLYQEDKLEEAKAEYEEFVRRWPDHPLKETAAVAKQRVEEALAFVKNSRDGMLRAADLDTHPLRSAKLAEETARLRAELAGLKGKDDAGAKERAAQISAELERRASGPLAIGPLKLPHPVLVLKTKHGTVRVELFEDEAPKSVATIVALAQQKYFDGLKIAADETRLLVLPKEKDPVSGHIPAEKTSREGDVGSLVLVRRPDGAGNQAAEFSLLLKDRPVAGETVAGVILDGGMPIARQIKADDVIEAATVEFLRDHEYVSAIVPDKK